MPIRLRTGAALWLLALAIGCGREPAAEMAPIPATASVAYRAFFKP